MCIRGRSLLYLVVLLSVSVSQAKEPKHNKNAEITVEVKFALLDQAVVEQLKQHGLLAMESTGKDVLSLDNAQMNRFMELIQNNHNTNVMQIAPLTMGNGRTAVFNPIDEQHFVTSLEIVYRDGQIEYRPRSETIPLGWRVALRSIVSKDRRSVRVHLDANANNLDSKRVPRFPVTTPAADGKTGTVTHFIEQPRITKIAVNRTMVIPDGNTAILTTGSKHYNVQATVSKIPGWCDLPWIGPRLFRTVAYDCRTIHLLVLVTPHIRVPQEKEEKPSIKAGADPEHLAPANAKCQPNDR